jgi:hypothetical protein
MSKEGRQSINWGEMDGPIQQWRIELGDLEDMDQNDPRVKERIEELKQLIKEDEESYSDQ